MQQSVLYGMAAALTLLFAYLLLPDTDGDRSDWSKVKHSLAADEPPGKAIAGHRPSLTGMRAPVNEARRK